MPTQANYRNNYEDRRHERGDRTQRRESRDYGHYTPDDRYNDPRNSRQNERQNTWPTDPQSGPYSRQYYGGSRSNNEYSRQPENRERFYNEDWNRNQSGAYNDRNRETGMERERDSREYTGRNRGIGNSSNYYNQPETRYQRREPRDEGRGPLNEKREPRDEGYPDAWPHYREPKAYISEAAYGIEFGSNGAHYADSGRPYAQSGQHYAQTGRHYVSRDEYEHGISSRDINRRQMYDRDRYREDYGHPENRRRYAEGPDDVARVNDDWTPDYHSRENYDY